jgi:hypothetical protein
MLLRLGSTFTGVEGGAEGDALGSGFGEALLLLLLPQLARAIVVAISTDPLKKYLQCVLI